MILGPNGLKTNKNPVFWSEMDAFSPILPFVYFGPSRVKTIKSKQKKGAKLRHTSDRETKFTRKTIQFCKFRLVFGKNRSFGVWEDHASSKQIVVWSVLSKFGLSWNGKCQKKAKIGVLDILSAKFGRVSQLTWMEGQHRPRKGFGDVASLTLSSPATPSDPVWLYIDTDFAVVTSRRSKTHN